MHRLITQVESGQVSRERATLNQLIGAWMEAAGPQGENTRLVYAGYVKRHIEPTIGKVAATKLRVEDLDRWYTALNRKGLSPASIRKAHNIVRSALTQGVKWGWLSTNIAKQSTPPSVPRAVIATPDSSDVAALIRYVSDLDPDLAAYVRLAAVTGARPGEMCGLRWRDLDCEKGEIAILRRVIKAEPEPLVKNLTKTGRLGGSRSMMGRSLRSGSTASDSRTEQPRSALRQRRMPSSSATPLTVSSFWRPDSTSRRFRAIRDKGGLPGVPLYGLRHQAATALIDAGVDPKTVSERLGNSVSTVLGTYTRARTSADRSAAELMGGLLDG